MSAYRISLPYEHAPIRRRASGFALAVAANVGLLLILLTLSKIAPDVRKISHALVVDLLPESHSLQSSTKKQSVQKPVERSQNHPVVSRKLPPIVLPSKPTIAVPPPAPPKKSTPWIEMSKSDMAAADISNLPKSTGGSSGDSEVAGTGPHGETLYRAEWARHPTDAEVDGYLPSHSADGFGLIACKTIPGDRVEDCIELDQTPGSHLASAVRQAAWQFRVRPPRKNGVPMIGAWVSIEIDYSHYERSASGL